MRYRQFIITLLVLFSAALGLSGTALATGGNYVFDGGTPAEQATARAALNASSFNWNLVPAQVTIHIARDIPLSYSTPGQTWLDANLLDAGQFSWSVVQMEYGQQVQYSLQDAAVRAELTTRLGASSGATTTRRCPAASTRASASPQCSRGPTGRRTRTR
jgi:hypothetical protein